MKPSCIGYLRHNASAASRLGPESPAAEDSEYINDKHTPRVLSTIPYSSEDVDSKIDTAETIPTGKRDAMSSDDFHGCRSQNKLQTRSVSMSNNHLTDQNGMHTLVLEAMKTIQKFELENEQQVLTSYRSVGYGAKRIPSKETGSEPAWYRYIRFAI